jgi:hypothetical protein
LRFPFAIVRCHARNGALRIRTGQCDQLVSNRKMKRSRKCSKTIRTRLGTQNPPVLSTLGGNSLFPAPAQKLRPTFAVTLDWAANKRPKRIREIDRGQRRRSPVVAHGIRERLRLNPLRDIRSLLVRSRKPVKGLIVFARIRSPSLALSCVRGMPTHTRSRGVNLVRPGHIRSSRVTAATHLNGSTGCVCPKSASWLEKYLES